MPRPSRSLHAYRLIEPDEQFDLFACREGHWHVAARQLALGGPTDRTLCGSFLPAAPHWRELLPASLRDRRLCARCKAVLAEHRRGGEAPPAAW